MTCSDGTPEALRLGFRGDVLISGADRNPHPRTQGDQRDARRCRDSCAPSLRSCLDYPPKSALQAGARGFMTCTDGAPEHRGVAFGLMRRLRWWRRSAPGVMGDQSVPVVAEGVAAYRPRLCLDTDGTPTDQKGGAGPDARSSATKPPTAPPGSHALADPVPECGKMSRPQGYRHLGAIGRGGSRRAGYGPGWRQCHWAAVGGFRRTRWWSSGGRSRRAGPVPRRRPWREPR